MVLQGCAKIVYSICTWHGFPILPFCEFPIAWRGFVHIQHVHITACLRSSYISLRVYVHHEGIANTLSSGESKLGLRGLRILISPTVGTGTYMSSQSTSSHVESTPGILKLEMHVVNSPQQATQCKGEE